MFLGLVSVKGYNSEGGFPHCDHYWSHQIKRMLSALGVEKQLYLLNTGTVVKHRLQVIANYIHRVLFTQRCTSSHCEIGDICADLQPAASNEYFICDCLFFFFVGKLYYKMINVQDKQNSLLTSFL